jgi:fibro-slime domain-containing protein
VKNIPKSLPVLVALVLTTPAHAAISLTGTIRDFNGPTFNNNNVSTGLQPGSLTPHPDFEYNPFVANVDPGMVANTLSGGVPVYVGTAPYGEVTSAASFAQWFLDVPNVNLSVTFSLSLNETAPNSGVFEYVNNSFFPIDNQLGGNQGQAHNYHFTFHIRSSFTYVQGQTFSFDGDDDVWVFINGNLAVDIGGIHQKALGSVSLDAAAASLGITPGGTYTFDFFFAERHTSESNFKISTTIPLSTPNPDPDPGITPEPASLTIWSLVCAGLGCAAYRRRRRALA